MPEFPWRRRVRRPGQDPAAAVAQVVPEPARQGSRGTAYLERAASCYLRAGNPAAAADCLSKLGRYDQAAQVWLDCGEYQQAVAMYLRTDELAEVSAWIYVHHLGEPAAAREVARRVSQRLSSAPRSAQGPDTARQSYLTDRLRRVRAHLEQQRISLPADAVSQATVSHHVIGQIVDLFDMRLTMGDLILAIKKISEAKTGAILRGDWLAGYAASEIESLLVDEQTVRLGERELVLQRSRFPETRMLSCDLVLARCDAAEGAPHQRITPVLAQTQTYLADSRRPWVPRIETWGVAIASAIRRYDQVALIFAAAVRGQRPGATMRWSRWSTEVLHTDSAMLTAAELS